MKGEGGDGEEEKLSGAGRWRQESLRGWSRKLRDVYVSGGCLGVFGITQGSALQLQAPARRSGAPPQANLYTPSYEGWKWGKGRGLKVAHSECGGGGTDPHGQVVWVQVQACRWGRVSWGKCAAGASWVDYTLWVGPGESVQLAGLRPPGGEVGSRAGISAPNGMLIWILPPRRQKR